MVVVEAEDSGSEKFTAAFGLCVAADNTFDAVRDFDFEPVAAAAFFVGAGPAFGDDAFEAFLSGGFEEGDSLPFVVVGIAEDFVGLRFVRNDQAGEFSFAFF